MTPFRERNPVPIGAVGLLVIAALLLAAFNLGKIPFIGGGTQYSAAFSEAGGLKPDDDVVIAGVKVGKVTDVALDGDQVKVTFKITKDAQFGRDTGASVRIKTLLGQKILSLEPAGTGQLPAGSMIPRSRTVAAYDVIDAFSDLTKTTERIDTTQLARALDTMATEFKNSPPEVKASLDGISRLSSTIASRDAALKELLAHANKVTGVLSARDTELATLVQDADLLMVELDKRKADITRLLNSTATFADQLTQLVRENRAALNPALTQVKAVLAVLQQNKANLEKGMALMAPFTRVFANTLGNGRWFDTYVQNLVPVPKAVP